MRSEDKLAFDLEKIQTRKDQEGSFMFSLYLEGLITIERYEQSKSLPEISWRKKYDQDEY